jgi:O-antigen/teichoic acid export membrane protein
VLQILSMGFVFVLPLCALHAVALSAGAGGWLLRAAVVGCVANVALNLVLIPRFGMHGAAAATVAGEALSMAVLAGGLRRHIWPLARVSRPTARE